VRTNRSARCLRGKIEEVALPASKVDIIVSEWMGYGLLFEAMLDSVLWARDHYLVKDGLMVPSHATLRIAPFVDADFVDSHIAFWNEVYGFKMTSMLEKIHDEVVVRTTTPSTAPAASAIFLELPLHTITIPDLTFVRDFQITLAEDIDRLDGWNIWFDTFFMPSADANIPSNAVPSHMKKKGVVAFTTGPDGPETHWQQCVLLIKHSRQGDQSMKRGYTIHGKIGYSKKEEGSRSLEICVQWNDGNQGASQSWSLQ
jgi:protein arginine N-methyltransferase 3